MTRHHLLAACMATTLAAAAPSAPPKPLGLDALAKANVMKDPGFKTAYLRALGPLAREYWLIDMDGPGDQQIVPVSGTRMLQVTVCKPHDCGDNAMMVVYSPATRALYGFVTVARRRTTLGQPPAALLPDLQRLWHAAWPMG